MTAAKALLLLGLVSLVAAFQCRADYSTALSTASVLLVINSHCEEGVVGCDNLTLTMLTRASGESVKMVGRELHSATPAGGPGAFQGYQFWQGKKPDGRNFVEISPDNVVTFMLNGRVALQQQADEIP